MARNFEASLADGHDGWEKESFRSVLEILRIVCESALHLIEHRSGLTSRQSQGVCLSRLVQSHESRQAHTWLTSNVRPKLT